MNWVDYREAVLKALEDMSDEGRINAVIVMQALARNFPRRHPAVLTLISALHPATAGERPRDIK